MLDLFKEAERRRFKYSTGKYGGKFDVHNQISNKE